MFDAVEGCITGLDLWSACRGSLRRPAHVRGAREIQRRSLCVLIQAMHGGPVGVTNSFREFTTTRFEGRLFLAALLDAGGGLQRASHFSLNAQPPSGGDEHATQRCLEAEQFRFEADQQHGHKQTERTQDVGQQPSAQHLAPEEEGQPQGHDDPHRAGIHGQVQTFERTLLRLQPAHQSQEHEKAEQEGMKPPLVHIHVHQFIHILDALTPLGAVDDEKSD